MQETPKISVITVGMNHERFMSNLLASIFKTNKPAVSFEFIYVDNCSTDASVAMISKEYPEVKIIENERPLGFGANNNLGVRRATGEFIAIINPDIEFTKGSLDYLFEFYRQLSFDAVLVPKLINPDGSLQYSARGFVTAKSFADRLLTRGRDDAGKKSLEKYLLTNMDDSKTQFVDWAIGAAFFTRRSLFDQLGGFDEDYFLYLEDTDFCLRAWQNGSPVIYVPNSVMIHNHLRTSSKKLKPAVIHLKSYFTYFKKHGFAVKSMIESNKHQLPST